MRGSEASQDKGKLDKSRRRNRREGEDGRREEKAWNENGVRRKKDIRAASVLPAPSIAVSTRSFRIDLQPLNSQKQAPSN